MDRLQSLERFHSLCVSYRATNSNYTIPWPFFSLLFGSTKQFNELHIWTNTTLRLSWSANWRANHKITSIESTTKVNTKHTLFSLFSLVLIYSSHPSIKWNRLIFPHLCIGKYLADFSSLFEPFIISTHQFITFTWELFSISSHSILPYSYQSRVV